MKKSLNLILLFLICKQFSLVGQLTNLTCQGVFTPTVSTAVAAPASAGCTKTSSTYLNKYRLQQTWVPNAGSALITVKITLHIFTQDNGQSVLWENTNSYVNGIPALQNYLADITNGNTERFSAMRMASYSTSHASFNPPYIYDSKVQFEVSNIYFYPVSSLYTNTVQGAQLNYIAANYPGRLEEGIPIAIANNSVHFSGVYNGARYVATSIGHAPAGPGQALFFQTGLRHELAHCFGLLHTYSNTCCPETINCTNIDYLSDVFPSGMAICTHTDNTLHQPTNPPCNSCYEWFNFSNNVLGGHASTWLSPLQMGRRIRTMRFSPERKFAKEVVSDHVNTWNITSNETWDFDIQMYEDIVVKNGATLTIKCKVALPINGKIIVEKGAQLVIDGGEVTTWCKTGPWLGIQVEGNPSANQTLGAGGYANNQGILRIINQGKLSKAGNAVSNYRTTNSGGIMWGTVGGIVIADGAVFENNARDVEFLAYPFSSASYFANTQFITNGPLGGTQTPHIHVSLWGVRDLGFYGCNFEYAAGTLFQNNKGMGIYSIDASYSVDQASNFAAPNLTPTTFKNLKYGIYVDNLSLVSPIVVQNSRFEKNDLYAAYIHNMNDVWFNQNYFESSQQTTSGGIYLNQCKYFNVRNNTFRQDQNARSGVGIYVHDSKDGSHTIYRNNFSDLSVGIIAINDNAGIYNPVNGLKMNCNNFFPSNNNEFDIAVLGWGTGFNMPNVMKIQGNIVGMAPTNVVRNIYGASCAGNSGNKWYTSNTNIQVAHGCNANFSGVITNPAPQPNCSSSLLSIQTLLVPLNYSTDCLANPESSGGDPQNRAQKIANINSYLSSLRSLGAAADPFELQTTVASKLNYFLLDTAPSSVDTVIKILKDNLGNMSDADIQLVQVYIKKEDYTTARALVAEMGTNRNDWKALLTKLIDIAQEPDKLYSINSNPNYIQFFTSLANSEGKDGQGIAQALLRFVNGTEYFVPQDRPESGINGKIAYTATNVNTLPEINGNQLKIYPNPTQNGAFVSWLNDEAGQAEISVTDLLGRQIYHTFIVNNSEKYIPLENCNSGIYFITVNKGNTTLYKNKLTKQQ
jgi:hypothetical protein